MNPESLPDPIEVALAFADVLEGLDVRYLIGGSLASSVHGEPRATNDIDVLADLGAGDVDRLAAALGRDYYMSASAAREAIRTAASFNVIHLQRAVKVDVFLCGNDPLNEERLRARMRLRVTSHPDRWLWIDTPEHSVLRKLEWFRRGGEASERQWRDVVAILRIQGGTIDRLRLREWAPRLRIGDLLERAIEEAQRAG